MNTNQLYYGDNLDILRTHIPDESVDLIYIDPPFNSNQAYNVIFSETDGSSSQAQIQAFEDTWHWGETTEQAYHELVGTAPHLLVETIKSFRGFLTETNLMAYLVMMALRLVELHRVLKPTGSFYLHCDPTASHYLKIILDQIFGAQTFRNEIIWKRTHAHGNAEFQFGAIHDTLFFYNKSNKPRFHSQFEPYAAGEIEKRFPYIETGTGRRFASQNLTNYNKDRPNLTYEWNGHTRTWLFTKEKMAELDRQDKIYYSSTGYPRLKQYLDESQGSPIGDIWLNISALKHSGKERLDYPTQKPEALLERVIKASSNEGDVVLDAFCGCGTAIAVAQRLNRRWIGIDITHLAITLLKYRLDGAFGDDVKYEVIGEPKDAESARALAVQDRYQFQWWALSLIRARPYQGKKKGADEGVDGVIYYEDVDPDKPKKDTDPENCRSG